jgi:preprotein translocase subunit SecG
MQNVLLTIHLIACIALVISVMLQRSEGGALGMSGGGTGGIISGRGAAGVLVKTTMGLAVVFFITSITMTYLHNQDAHAPSILDTVPAAATPATPAPTGPDPLGRTVTTPPAATPATPTPAPSAATPDPLAPNAAPPAGQTAPATPQPTAPAPTPENGGSPN